jgi:hypothetical protein
MPPCPKQQSEFPVTKAEQTLTEISHLARPVVNVQVYLEAVALRPRGVFYSKIRKPRWGARVHCQSEAMVECPQEARGRAT